MAAADLERAVEKQVADNTFDLENNLDLLKLYQFQPELTSEKFACLILIKSLMQLPSPDVRSCVCLLGPALRSSSDVEELLSLVKLLESGKFLKFWGRIEEAHSAPSSYCWTTPLLEIPGLVDSVRNFIVGVVTMTYHSVSAELITRFLNLDSAELSTLCSKRGWSLDGENVVIQPKAHKSKLDAPGDRSVLRAQDVIAALRDKRF